MSESDPIWAEDGSAEAVARHMARVIAAHPQVVIAVPGGSTPLPIFEKLVDRGIDWSGVTLMLGDDRIVEHGHAASNQAKLEGAFCATEARIVALEEGMEVPDLDLLCLGMGEDGHIASLFPKMEAGDVPGRKVIRTRPVPLPLDAPFPRLSMNMEALTEAPREIILVIRGKQKKRVLEDAIAGRSTMPVATLIARAICPITIYWSPE
ncbi:6-phosphogluconolactonase [Qipengyuania spongiae]|uniref:6-phosphogluconolactonase n=1 Tax=Qipengyuania spongiae TaxID=2909673 RepID=A0ABY5T1A4_9SPHN|nr:6-phosphogluconolactonase [Qipengyuania spongiae]UVI40575.1 6-phosphogluconolactonase [Qipengyuania spongiae]